MATCGIKLCKKLGQEDLAFLQEVELACYPEQYRSIADCERVSDLKDYCEGKPTVWKWERGYCIATSGEVVDLASTTSLSLSDMIELHELLRKHFGGRVVTMDAREGTSYKLLKFAEKRKRLQILSDRSYDWGGETFHELELIF
jgi:hypothetical protein